MSWSRVTEVTVVLFIRGTVVDITDLRMILYAFFKKVSTKFSANIYCRRVILKTEVTVMKKSMTITNQNNEDRNFERTVNRVSFVTVVGNTLLSAVKLLAGIISHSNAMISDAVHSASDVLSTVAVIIGVKFASKKPDKEHPYGHERLECVAAVILSVLLFITGLGIGIEALKNIRNGNYGNLQVPGISALIAAIVSIVSKEAMYWYTRYYAKKIDSSALMADAWHHRSDALSSIGALIGIAGARLGFPIMDSVASLAIFLFIIKAALDIFKDAMNKMIDRSCDEETEKQIYDRVMKNENVLGIDLLKTRIFGNKIYVDVEFRSDASYSLEKAHGVADTVENDIEQNFPKVKHIMIHINPSTVKSNEENGYCTRDKL